MTYTDKIKEEQIKSEAAKFWDIMEKNLPNSYEVAALGKHKIYEAFYPAFVQFHDFFLSKHNTLLDELETEIKKYKCGDHKRLLAFIETKR